MTNLEQLLTYISNEIKFMGASSMRHASYTDRVIEDITGVDSVCSRMMASRRPATVIMGVIQGPRGKLFVRFFDRKLHQARMELVQLLANVSISRSRKNYDSLMKLYKKSVKQARSLIDPKGNFKYSDLDDYPELQALTGMGSARSYFDDEEDPDDSYSDYADAYMDALRTGMDLPRPRAGKPFGLDLDFTENDDALDLIHRIQKRVGRQLTPAEAIQVLKMAESDEDEDDDEEVPGIPQGPDTMALVTSIANMVLAKLTMGQTNPEVSKDEPIRAVQDLDELMDQVEAQKSNPIKSNEPIPSEGTSEEPDEEPVAETTVIDPQPRASLTQPVHPNSPERVFVENPDNVPTQDLIRAVNHNDLSGLASHDSEQEEEDAPSESQGPDVKSGPYLTSNNQTESIKTPDESSTVSSDFQRVQEAFQSAQSISAFLATIGQAFDHNVGQYLKSVDALPIRTCFSITPSSKPDQVLKVTAVVAANALDTVDPLRVIMGIVGRTVNDLAQCAHLEPEQIETETRVCTADTEVEEFHKTKMECDCRESKYGLPFRHLSHLVVALALYYNSVLGQPVEIHYLNQWSGKDTSPAGSHIWVSTKNNTSVTASIQTGSMPLDLKAATELLNQVTAYQSLVKTYMESAKASIKETAFAYNLQWIDNGDWSEFQSELNQALKTDPWVNWLLDENQAIFKKAISNLISDRATDYEVLDTTADASVVDMPQDRSAGFDIMYNAQYKAKLSSEQELALERDFDQSIYAQNQLEFQLRVISDAPSVTGFIKLENVLERAGYCDEDTVPDEKPKTNFFERKPDQNSSNSKKQDRLADHSISKSH